MTDLPPQPADLPLRTFSPAMISSWQFFQILSGLAAGPKKKPSSNPPNCPFLGKGHFARSFHSKTYLDASVETGFFIDAR